MDLGGITQGLSMPGLELPSSPMTSWAPDLTKMPAMPSMSMSIPGIAFSLPRTQMSVVVL